MAKKPQPNKPPNPAAKALAEGRHRPQVLKPKKGKGSYQRKTGEPPEPSETTES